MDVSVARRAETLAPAAGNDFDFVLYRYNPSLAGAIIGVVVFGALTGIHAWRIRKMGTLYFIPFTIGGLFETIGYAGRVWSHFAPSAIGGFVMQAILILIAPALFAASIYMILGRLIHTLRADHLFFLRVVWVTRIFVTGDVCAFTLQAGGGGIQSGGTLELFNIGEKIIVVGLFMQLAFFGFFVISASIFHTRLLRNPTPVAREGTIPWHRHLIVLYVTSGLILVRSIFRVIEYLQGNAGYIISHEVFLYVFDMVLMVAVMVIFLVWHVDGLESTRADHGRQELSSSSSGMLQDMTPKARPDGGLDV